MFLFTISTNVNSRRTDVRDFISKALPNIAKRIAAKPEHVGLVIHRTTKGSDTELDRTDCEITHFKEELSVEIEDNLRKVAIEFSSFFNKWFNVKKHEFVIKVLGYKNRILVDWTRNHLIASMPINNQRGTKTCWAFAASDVISCNYIVDHSVVNFLEKSISSTQEFIDWVYSVKRLCGVLVDEYGTYPTHASNPFSYARQYGISLSANYAVDFKKRTLETRMDEIKFREMRAVKGPRIFVKGYKGFVPNTNVFSIESVTKLLSQGALYGSIKYCKGSCSIPGCNGFGKFDGNGIYEEPPHPENHVYGHHGVTVLRVGEREGTVYVHIRNSYGPSWGKGGCGDLHIKCFTKLFQVLGTEKKEWSGVEKNGFKYIF